jgi:hypothetical protein
MLLCSNYGKNRKLTTDINTKTALGDVSSVTRYVCIGMKHHIHVTVRRYRFLF